LTYAKLSTLNVSAFVISSERSDEKSLLGLDFSLPMVIGTFEMTETAKTNGLSFL